MENQFYRKTLLIAAFTALIAAVAFLGLKYLLPVFMPFIIAWLIAFALQPVVNLLKRKLKIPKKLSVPVLVLIATALLGLLAGYFLERAYGEVQNLIKGASDFLEKLKNDEGLANLWIDRINSLVPFADLSPTLHALWSELDTTIESAVLALVSELSGSVMPILSDIIAFVPDALLYVFVIIVSSYYFAVDFDAVNRGAISWFPARVKKYASVLKRELRGTLGNFVRAYSLIITITFTELFIFFSLLGVKYAFLIALFTSLVDILPVLGTGTVLLPWAAVCFISGNNKFAIGLLVCYAVVTVVRQVIEPRIVGKCIGISPLAALVSMYVGLKLLGITGLFVLPVGLIIARNVMERKKGETENAIF